MARHRRRMKRHHMADVESEIASMYEDREGISAHYRAGADAYAAGMKNKPKGNSPKAKKARKLCMRGGHLKQGYRFAKGGECVKGTVKKARKEASRLLLKHYKQCKIQSGKKKGKTRKGWRYTRADGCIKAKG